MSLNVKAYPLKKDNCEIENNDQEGMQHNLHKSYVMQIMYKNMNEYDYNEEMPVDTGTEAETE